MSYATAILNAAATHYRSGQADTSALDLQAVALEIATAIGYLEGLQRGAKINFGTGAPAAGVGLAGDAYFDVFAGDVYGNDVTLGWQLQGHLRGADGRTPVKGIDYSDGRTPVKGVDYRDGTNGKSAFELYQAGGGLLSQTAWLAAMAGKSGLNGADGNRFRWESVAPTSSDGGQVGDAWFYAFSSNKVLLYECYRTAELAAADPAGGGQWRLRFTSPDPVAGSGGGGTGGSYTLPDASGTVLGGIKLGVGLTHNPTTGQVDADPTNGVTLASAGDGTGFLANDGSYKSIGVGVGTGTTVQFDKSRDYPEIANGTFTVDATGRKAGVTIKLLLGSSCTAIALDPTYFEKLGLGIYVDGQAHMYCFSTSTSTGKIQYTISIRS